MNREEEIEIHRKWKLYIYKVALFTDGTRIKKKNNKIASKTSRLRITNFSD